VSGHYYMPVGEAIALPAGIRKTSGIRKTLG
jgi:hypothetical protein